jgi:hypothetical protein
MATATAYAPDSVDVGSILPRLASLGVAPALDGLDEALGVDGAELADLLTVLQDLDLVTIWGACPGGAAIVLTPLGVARAGVAMSADSERWLEPESRYVDVDKEHRLASTGPVVAASQVRRSDGDETILDELPDPASHTPEAELEAVETLVMEWRAAHKAATEGKPAKSSAWRTPDRLPLPHAFLGTRETWPIAPDGLKRCGACHGRKLKPGEYCLACQRWGLDSLLKRRPAPKPTRTSYKPDPVLKGGVG